MDEAQVKFEAELLMAPFLESVIASPIRVAPERTEDYAALFNGPVPYVDFTNTKANFEAHPGEQPSVDIRFSALLSLWATAKASLRISDAMATAMRSAIDQKAN